MKLRLENTMPLTPSVNLKVAAYRDCGYIVCHKHIAARFDRHYLKCLRHTDISYIVENDLIIVRKQQRRKTSAEGVAEKIQRFSVGFSGVLYYGDSTRTAEEYVIRIVGIMFSS